MSNTIRVVVVDEKAERAERVEAGLVASGCQVVARLCGGPDLADQINRSRPDVIIIDMDNPGRDVLEDMFQITRHQPRPTVMFVDRSDSESIAAAIQAGVSAYVVDGFKPDRVRAVLEVAIARFNEFQALRRQLENAKETLEERKLIERAKGILMKSRKLSEDDAFHLLRRLAMDRKARLATVAREVIAAAELLL